MTLILDLDHTLVYTTNEKEQEDYKEIKVKYKDG